MTSFFSSWFSAVSHFTVSTPIKIIDDTKISPDTKVLVALTWAELDISNRSSFDTYSGKIVHAMPKMQGLVCYSLRKELLGSQVWTYSVWRDQLALAGFMRSDVHRAAIRFGNSAVIKMSKKQIWTLYKDLPSNWNEILALHHTDQTE